jgi:hypothetical protein
LNFCLKKLKNKTGMAQTALRQFTRLYALEKQFKDLTIGSRLLATAVCTRLYSSALALAPRGV